MLVIMPLSFRFDEVGRGVAARAPFWREHAPLLGARAVGTPARAAAPAPRVPTGGTVDRSALFIVVVLVVTALTLGIYATARTTETVNAAHALVEAISTTYWSGSVSEELAATEHKLARDAETERSIAATLSTLLVRINALAAELGAAARRR